MALIVLVRIAGLGPGDPRLVTIGSLDALRAIGRVAAPLAPPDLSGYLARNGVEIVRGLIDDATLFMRGAGDEIECFVARLRAGERNDLGLGVLGNPLSDFPGLPSLLRSLERAEIATEIVPGMPRATLSASMALPL